MFSLSKALGKHIRPIKLKEQRVFAPLTKHTPSAHLVWLTGKPKRLGPPGWTMQLFLPPLDGVRNGEGQSAAIRTTRHDSSSVEYRGSHRQVSGTHRAEIRACSAVCEWGRNERKQARLNGAPVGCKGLAVLTDSPSVWFGSLEKVKCLCVLLISSGSLASLNSPAGSANLSAEKRRSSSHHDGASTCRK